MADGRRGKGQGSVGDERLPPLAPPSLKGERGFRRALDLLLGRITALEARITELNAVLADPELYRRDPARFRNTTEALALAKDELAAAEEQWLRLEMMREQIEGIEPRS